MTESTITDALNALTVDGVRADGQHDDADGLQKAIDNARTVHLPHTDGGYLISKTLKIGSGQTLIADRQARIRLADHSRGAHLVENSDQREWQDDISVIGGIWDGNNETQTCHYHETARYEEGFSGDGRIPYDPDAALGMIFQFDKVRRLVLRGCTFKDPEMFAVHMGNLEDFLVEDIHFDFNMKKFNMDGIHVHGNSRRGLIRNLHGSTNDDMVALNADDGPMCEIARGPIEDIVVDGLFAGDRGFTGVRLLSCGNPVRRVRISNVFGKFKLAGVYFSHHNVHPGEPSLFEDIIIDGLWFSRCRDKMTPALLPEIEKNYDDERHPIWVAPTTQVTNLTVRSLNRRESHEDCCPATIRVFSGGKVDFLDVSATNLVNTAGSIGLLHNDGEIGQLSIRGLHVESPDSEPTFDVQNGGTIDSTDIIGSNVRV